jgi:hypothetical protein
MNLTADTFNRLLKSEVDYAYRQIGKHLKN